MSVIYIVGAVQAIFLFFLFMGKKNKPLADYFLSSLLLAMAFLLIDNYFENIRLHLEYPHLLGITYCFPILIGPLCFFYVKLMTDKEPRFRLVDFIHFIPFSILIIFFLFEYYFLGASEKLDYYRKMTMNPTFMIYLSEFLLTASGPIYTIVCIVLIRKHQKAIADNFSYTEKINLRWLSVILYGMIVSAAVSLLMFVLSDVVSYIPFWLGDNIMFITMTIVIFFFGYFGIKQQAIYIFPNQGIIESENGNLMADEHGSDTMIFQLPDDNSTKYKRSGLSKEDADIYVAQLLEFMKNEEPYLDSKLSLKQVSDVLNISTNHLSQVINDRMNMNFYHFVNQYRVEKVKESIAANQNQNLTLLAIAYDAGFNSKTTFNTIFKKYTGQTPSQYIQDQNN